MGLGESIGKLKKTSKLIAGSVPRPRVEKEL